MGPNPAHVGAFSAVYEYRYDWRKLVLYALGIGAKADELDYLYEARGPKVFPSFGVVPSYPVLTDLIAKSGGNIQAVVHGGQLVRVLGELPPSGVLRTQGTISGIYDMKRMATMTLETQTTCEGRAVYQTEWMIVFREGGGFGGPRPPKNPAPKLPRGTAPAWSIEDQVPREQALLYRLSGDENPLHADPDYARQVGFDQGPILHGLCTYGYVCRAAVKAIAGGDAARIKLFAAQFKQPVWPGEALRTVGYQVDGRWALEAYAAGRPEPVVAQAYVELA